MNQFELVGRVLEQPVKSESSAGIKMARIKVCVDKIKDEGESQEIYEVVVFRQLAELELVKGQYVAIVGKLSANNRENNGTVYYNCSLIGTNLTLLIN